MKTTTLCWGTGTDEELNSPQEPTNQRVYIYKWALPGCSNYGISSAFDVVTDTDEENKPDGIRIVAWYDGFKAVPSNDDGTPNTSGVMGGTYVMTSDSRWRSKYSRPIPLHDRFES